MGRSLREGSAQRTITTPNGVKYSGEWKDGKENGYGIMTAPNGHKYEGEFKDKKAHGQGNLTLPDGRKYIGDWKEGKIVGRYVNGVKED